MSPRKKKGVLGSSDTSGAADDWSDAEDDVILELPPPPDGGYGWVVLFASFICNMVVSGVCYTFGVFLNDFVEYFGEPKSKISWAGSLLGGGSYFMGPVASGFTNLYGCRPVVIVGAVLSATFLALSVVSPNADVLILTYGLTGFASSVILIPAIVSVSYYFEKKRTITTCISACGSSVGSLCSGPVALLLLNRFSWRGANLVLSIVYLSLVICGVLMIPLKAVAVPKEEKKELLYQLTQRRGTCVSFGSGNFDEKLFQVQETQQGADITQTSEVDRNSGIKKSAPCPVMCKPADGAGKRKFSEPILHPIEQQLKSRSIINHGAQKYRVTSEAMEEERPSISIYSVRRRQSCFNLPPTEQSVCVRLADNRRVQKSLSHGNIVSPLSRKDSFFMGSVKKLKQQHPKKSLIPYRQSVLRFNPVANVEVVKDSKTDQPDGNKLSRFFHESFLNVLTDMVDVSLLNDVSFVLIGLGNIFGMMGCFVPFFFIVDAAKEQGVDESSATFLISTIGVANCIGRALSGVAAALPGIDPFMVHNLGMLLCGVSAFCIGLMSDFIGFANCAACFGFFGAMFVALTSTVLVSLLGLDKLTSAIGLLCLFRGVAVMIGSPLAGIVYDASGGYQMAFFFSGAMLMIGSGFCTVIVVVKRCQKRDRRGTKICRS